MRDLNRKASSSYNFKHVIILVPKQSYFSVSLQETGIAKHINGRGHISIKSHKPIDESTYKED